MIDPSFITNLDASDNELEELALFWICAAGKNGTVAARLLDCLLKKIGGKSPFFALRAQNPSQLPHLMKECGIGCYQSKSRSMIELAHSKINLGTCTPTELEKIHGIGRKTSRCFILHSRKDARYAALDTHILKFLRAQGIDAPKSTPASKKKYIELEKEFLALADAAGKTPAEFDLEIWNAYAVR